MSRQAEREAERGRGRASASLAERLFETRRRSLTIAEPLSPEDMTVQAMEDASPTKWHLAHVTWFFETFVLTAFLADYEIYDQRFPYCFNSYYESAGPRQPRPSRGLLTRPSCEEVLGYRRFVDRGLERLLAGSCPAEAERLIELGIQHEQQHQELMLTDILALFGANPLRPAYRAPTAPAPGGSAGTRSIELPGGICRVGHRGPGFCWDNERPDHSALLQTYSLADGVVTNGEWLEFMRDGGYRKPLLWLAEGWAAVQREGWEAPGYWEQSDGGWRQMTLEGLLAPDPAAPVCHVSYYEADAFARWAGKRLPTEHEWEAAVVNAGETDAGDREALRPEPAAHGRGGLRQAFGAVWQWTASAYLPYPGYRAPEGAIGEYNGKFMVSQHVLRGSSCLTPSGHSRPTYRNFFYPHQRWQMTGVRLAAEVES